MECSHPLEREAGADESTPAPGSAVSSANVTQTYVGHSVSKTESPQPLLNAADAAPGPAANSSRAAIATFVRGVERSHPLAAELRAENLQQQLVTVAPTPLCPAAQQGAAHAMAMAAATADSVSLEEDLARMELESVRRADLAVMKRTLDRVAETIARAATPPRRKATPEWSRPQPYQSQRALPPAMVPSALSTPKSHYVESDCGSADPAFSLADEIRQLWVATNRSTVNAAVARRKQLDPLSPRAGSNASTTPVPTSGMAMPTHHFPPRAATGAHRRLPALGPAGSQGGSHVARRPAMSTKR